MWYNSQTMERAQMSINRWTDKEDVIQIYIKMEYDSAGIICFNVDGTGGYYAEWNKWIGEGQTYGLIHLGNLNNSERE